MLKEGMAKAEIVTVLRRYAYDINRISALMPDGGDGQGRAVEAEATKGCHSQRL